MDDLVAKLRTLAEEWHECCGDIHETLIEAANQLELQSTSLTTMCEVADELHEALADTFVGKYDFTTHCHMARKAIENYRRVR